MPSVLKINTGLGAEEFAFSAQGVHADWEIIDFTKDESFTLTNEDNNTLFFIDHASVDVQVEVPLDLMETFSAGIIRNGVAVTSFKAVTGVDLNTDDAAEFKNPVPSGKGDIMVLWGYGVLNEFRISGDRSQIAP